MAKNKNHRFLVTLKMDGKTIATRATDVDHYPEDIIYSLRLNQLMIEMVGLVEEALKENDIERIFAKNHQR